MRSEGCEEQTRRDGDEIFVVDMGGGASGTLPPIVEGWIAGGSTCGEPLEVFLPGALPRVPEGKADMKRCALWQGFMRHLGWLTPVLGVLLACGGSVDDEEKAVASSNQALSSTNLFLTARNLTLNVPALASADPLRVAMASSSKMTLGGSAKVQLPSGPSFIPAPVANAGTGKVWAEPGALLGTITSRGAVELRDRVHVAGDVAAPGLVRGNNVTIDGALHVPSTPQLGTAYSWSLQLPSGTFPRLTLSTDERASVAPNKLWGEATSSAPARYAGVIANPRSKLTLSSGTYYLEDFDLEPEATLLVDSQAGPVVVYVHKTFIYRGSVQAVQGEPDLLFVYTGTSEVVVERPLFAGIVAPLAKVTLRSTQTAHQGQILAKEVFLDANATLRLRTAGGLLPVGGTDRDTCIDKIRSLGWPDTREGLIAQQQALRKYCYAVGEDGDVGCVRAKSRVDRYLVARSLIKDTIDPRAFLCVMRDLTAKSREASLTPTLAHALCSEPDSDGDWVPDNQDVCPGSEPFACVDEQGCVKELPEGPSREDVQAELDDYHLIVNPYCSGHHPRAVSIALAIYWTNPDVVAFVVSRLDRYEPQCPLYYQIEWKTRGWPTPGESKTIEVIVPDTQATHTGHWGPLPEPWVEVTANETDNPEISEMLDIYLNHTGNGEFRVRAFNDIGVHGPWSDWREFRLEDCHTIGFFCGA